ncbi:glycosyl hydrolase family 18 protein [Patescibacteria group bacterium]
MKNRFLIFFCGILVSIFFFSSTAFAASVSAWLPSWDVEEAFDSFQQNKDIIDVVSPFWYHVNADGSLSPTANSEDQTIIDFAKDNGIPVIPTISNSFDGDKVSTIINDDVLRNQNIQNIVNTVLMFDYDGIDIDYEGLNPTDTDAFTNYMKELHDELNKNGKKLTIAVMSKSYSMLPIYGTRGQDWDELGKYVDEFRIMTYDYGWSGSIPRPVAPYYWVEEVVQYAVDHVPTEKIRLGIPFYGYAWSDNGEEEGAGKEFYSYTYETILYIVEKYGVDFQYDPNQRTNRLFYLSANDDRDPVDPFEIWFENHVSLEPKLDLVEKYGLGGIAIWRLGKEDEENWRLIGEHLKGHPTNQVQYFDDVTADTPYYESINRLAFLGLVKGQGDTGLFTPLSKVNRAEILKMSLNSFAVDTSRYTFPETRSEFFTNPFPDVIDGEWFFSYIQTAAENGIVNGYPDGTFRPESNIIRVEALKLALECAGINLSQYDDSEWYFPYRDWSFDNGLYTAEYFKADEEINRAEAAYILEGVIEVVEAK